MFMKNTILAVIFLLISFNTSAKLALVYDGDGACPEDCALAAGQMAELSGLQVHYVNPQNYSRDLLKDAVIWIQPGGTAVSAAKAMGQEMMNDIKEFIAQGGAYVGFCAGTFISTAKIGTSKYDGFGIVPGRTGHFLGALGKKFTSEPVLWTMPDGSHKIRKLYWEGGPTIKLSLDDRKKVKILARYMKTLQVAGVQTTYGKGKVAVTALHPEAPQWWLDSLWVKDSTDWDLVQQMIAWVLESK